MGLQMEVQLTPNGKLSGHSGAICTNVHLLTFHHLIDQQDEIRSQKIIFHANQNSKKTIASHEKSPNPEPTSSHLSLLTLPSLFKASSMLSTGASLSL